MTPSVDQKGASAQGDIVGRDKTETHYYGPPPPAGIVEQLLKKLQAEVDRSEKVRHTVEALQHFHSRRAHDGIDGLEAKLKAGGRSHEYEIAVEKKEMFAKVLEKWALYASAQEIFAYLLAKAEHEFTYIVHPQIGKLSEVELNQLISERIVVPTIAECGASVFVLNHSVVMGMLYWLAEQCFVRWHQ